MSTRDENVRLRIQALSDLPTVNEQLEELIRLNQKVLETSHQNALSSRVDNAQVVTAIGGVTDALKAQQKAGKDAGDSTAEGAKKSNAELEKLAGQVRNFATLVGTAFTFEKLREFGSEIIDTKTKIDSLKIALDVMLGSKAESAKLYEEFVKLAKTTPFTLEEVAEQGVKLKAYNIATADIIPTINALGNMAAAVGKEKLPQLTLAYGQVANTGKLMGTELKQFTEAGIPLFDLLAKAMDKPKEAVIELANAHQISFADVRKAVMQASQEGGQYYNLMILQSKTLGGQVSNLADSYFIAKARIGDFFEGTIKKGIGTLNDLVGATVGSNSAIERTLDIIKVGVSTFVAYQAATRGAAIQSTALAAAEAAKATVIGTTNLVMITLKGTTEGFTRAQLESAVASRAMWAGLATNPVGAVIAAVALLTAGYYAFKAVNAEVVSQLGEEEIKLRGERDNLNALAKAALLAADGSKQRKDAIDLLIKNYPQYFSGLNSEKTNNQQLKGILDAVNNSYAKRIDLAREAYKSEGLAKAQKEFFEKEDEFFTTLQERLGKSDQTLAPFQGSVKKLIDTLKSGGPAAEDLRDKLDDAFGNGAKLTQLRAQQILNGFIQIERQSTESAGRTAKINADAQTAEVEAVKKKYDALEQQAAGNSKKLATLKTQEAAEIAKIEGTASEISYNNTVKTEEAKAAKQKQITLLTAKELAVLEKGFAADTLAEKIKLLDAQQAAEIAAINKATVSRKASAAEIARLQEEAEQKVLDIIAKYSKDKEKLYAEDRENFSRSLDVDISAFGRNNAGVIDYLNVRRTAYKVLASESAKAIKDSEKEIQDTYKETAKINADTLKVQTDSRKQLIDLGLDLLSQQSGLIGQLSQGIKVVYANMDGLSSKAQEAAGNQLANAQNNLKLIQALYDDGGQRTALQVAQAQKQVAEAENSVANVGAKAGVSALAIFGVVSQILNAVADAYNQMVMKTNQAIADGLAKVKATYQELNDFINKSSRESLDLQLQDTSLSLEQRKTLINQYYDQAAERAKGQDQIEATIGFNQKIAQLAADSGKDIKAFMEGITRLRAEQESAQYQIATRDAQNQIEQAALVRDATIEYLNQSLEAFKTAKQKESDAAAQALDKDKKKAAEYYSDKQLRALEDDVFRAQLLQQGEAREVKALEDAKQREIVRAQEKGASAEEVARITTAFDKLIADKHAEYQDAIGTKTKEVSLGNQELKSQEADKVQSLELETANKIKAIQLEIANMQARTEFNRKLAQQDYAEAKERSEKAIFENTKKMQVAQLEGEIAILRAKRNVFNSGAIDNAVGQLYGAIDNINGLAYQSSVAAVGGIAAIADSLGGFFSSIGLGLGGFVPKTPIRADDRKEINSAYDKAGNFLQITYNPLGKKITVYDKDGKPFDVLFADGYVPVTGEKFATGTDYLDRGTRPMGTDTIPAWLNEGERILSTSHNQQIGGRGLSNDELVRKITGYDRLAAQFPQLLDPARWSSLARTQIMLPNGIVNATGGKSIDVDGLRDDLKSVRKAIENQKTFSVNVDKTGFSTALLSAQGKTNYVQNLLNR